jgi:predicted acyltransferase
MSSVAEAAPARKRVFSIDALRGFDMFWIIGGLPAVVAIVKIFCDGLPEWFSEQSQHAAWEGFTAWDMVMPLFLFIVGAAMPFAFAKRREEGEGIVDLYWRVFRRVVVLWVLGMMVQGHLLNFDLFPVAFFSNTLQAIAVGYLVSAILMLHFPLAIQVVATALLLIGYWLLMLLVPFGQSAAGTLTADANLARYIDETLLAEFRDMEAPTYTWILSSMGFVATVMLGVFGGRVVKSYLSGLGKVLWLIVLGAVCLALGYVWSGWFEEYFGLSLLNDWRCPCIKHIWSSSMVLWSAGWCYLLLALFYLLLDVIGLRFLGWLFVVIGVNSIFAYVIWHLVSFPGIAQGTGGVVGFVGGLARYAPTLNGEWGLPAQTWRAIGDAIVPCAAILILWLILLYMYRKGTFLKV